MSFQIETSRVVQFGQNFYQLAQQKGSRLRNCVMVDNSVTGKRMSMEQIGATAAVRRTSRHGDTPLISTPHSRRWINLGTYEWADLVDQIDKLQTITDPTSIYATNAAAAFGRAMDDEIIAAATATSTTGEEAGSTVSFPSGNIIAVNSWKYGTGSGNAGLTISKLIEAKVLFDSAEAGIEPDEPRYIACSGKQIANLLSTTEATSEDYNSVKALVEGRVDRFMGFNFIRTERLGVDASSYRKVLAWVKSGIGLAIQKEPVARIGERPDKKYAIQVYSEMSIGSSRLEEAKVAQILCLES